MRWPTRRRSSIPTLLPGPPRRRHPGYPLSRLPANISTFGGLLVDCSPVLAALDRNITRRPGKTVEPDLKRRARHPAVAARRHRRPSSRRFSRTHFPSRGDLVAGLASGDQLHRRQRLSRALGRCSQPLRRTRFHLQRMGAGRRKSGRLPPALSSRAKEDPRRRRHRRPCNHASRARSTSAWCAAFHLAGRLEIGLQLLSPQISVVDVLGAMPGKAGPSSAQPAGLWQVLA